MSRSSLRVHWHGVLLLRFVVDDHVELRASAAGAAERALNRGAAGAAEVSTGRWRRRHQRRRRRDRYGIFERARLDGPGYCA